MGGHEGEDNVLRDDDLALFLTINVGFGAVPMIPSLPRLWWLRPKSYGRAVSRNAEMPKIFSLEKS